MAVMEVAYLSAAIGLFALVWCVDGTISTNLFDVKSRTPKSRLPRNAIEPVKPKGPPPQFLFLRHTPPNNLEVGIHESRVLECEAGGSPPPTLHWLRDGRPLSVSSYPAAHGQSQSQQSNAISEEVTPLMGLGSTRARLFLDCVGPQDIAAYSCVAESPFQRISTTTHVTIAGDGHSPLASMCVSAKKSIGSNARIVMWSGSILEEVGSDAVLFCRALGSPKPRMSWSIDDEPLIRNNAKYQVQENGDLLIRRLEWSDMGEYTCLAENSLGMDTVTTFLYPVKKDE